jgi:hypothetical protein
MRRGGETGSCLLFQEPPSLPRWSKGRRVGRSALAAAPPLNPHLLWHG